MKSKKLNYQSYDGYNLEGILIKASEEKAGVLFVHGISSSMDELGFHSDYAVYLSDNGITCLRFDLRYHGVYESSLERLTLGGIINDIDASFDTLKQNCDSSTKSFFIIGTSFGGGLSVYWADKCGKKELKKIILNAPVINYEQDVLGRNDLVNEKGLTNDAQKHLDADEFVISSDIKFGRGLLNELKYINGIESVKRLGEKIVIFHGDMDEDVPLDSSQKYMSEKSQLNIVSGVGHGFGVEGDEDLDFPETKMIHRSIYEQSLKIMKEAI